MRHLRILLFFACGALSLTVLLGSAQPPGDDKKEPGGEEKKPAVKVDPEDEEFLRRANLTPDAASLLASFQKRILPEKDRPEIERLIRRLGSSDYRIREKAFNDLVQRGPAALEVIRSAPAAPLEVTRRIDGVIQRIKEKDGGAESRSAAVRVLAQLNPDGLVEALVGYLPFADHGSVIEEIRHALLKHAVRDGKPNPQLLTALRDRSPLRRAVAAEVLGRTAYAEQKDLLHTLLKDLDPVVRYRTARGLALAQDKAAIPALIDALTDLPVNIAWQDEDFLLRIAGAIPPPVEPMGNTKEAREKCKAAWQAWWTKHADKVELAKLEDDPKMLGRTLIVLLDEKMVMELGPDNRPRWEIHDVNYPLDAQLIGDDQVLLAEYYGHRISVRDSRGKVLWQKTVQGPQAAQRLANGNTFVATGSEFLEFDKDGRVVDSIAISDDASRNIMKAMKLPNGEIVCMTADARIVRYSAAGKAISSFPIEMGMRLYGGRIHALASGRVLVPHNAEGKVVEYDSRGKAIWEVPFQQPIAATRLPNGNTIITSMDPAVGAVEVDRTGAEVWSFRSTNRVTRAIRR